MPAKKQTPKPETAIVPTAATRELTPGVWSMIERMAPVMHKAHLFGVTSPDQAAAIMLKGYELGLSITASFELIHVIDGKPGLSPRGAMALLLSNPTVKNIQIKKLTDAKGVFTGYECTMSRESLTHTSKFTLEDATRAGLMKPNSGWVKYPENMTLWRAIGFCADIVFPDITAGMTSIMKAPEMYGVALTDNGDIIDVASEPVNPLQELVTQYGAENVMQANDGRIPTGDEIEQVRKKLSETVKV